MVERRPEQARQTDMPTFKDLQFPKMRFLYTGLVPDTAPEGFEPYSDLHVAYDSQTGVRAIVGERRKPRKHKFEKDKPQYYILGEDLLPMHEDGLSSITGINSNSVTGKKHNRFGKSEMYSLVISEDAVRMVKGKSHSDSDIKFRQLEREIGTDDLTNHGLFEYTVTDTFDFSDTNPLNVSPHPVFAKLYKPQSQRKPLAVATPISGETILGVIQKGDYKKEPEPEPKKVERPPTLDELQFPPFKLNVQGGLYRESNSTGLERPQTGGEFRILVDKETGQFALTETVLVKNRIGNGTVTREYVLNEKLERVNKSPIQTIIGFEGEDILAKYSDRGRVHRLGPEEVTVEKNRMKSRVRVIPQSLIREKLQQGISGRDIAELIRVYVSKDDIEPSLAVPSEFARLLPEIPAPTFAKEKGETEVNGFTMPELTPDLKVAQWEEREGRYYLQGIDNHEGYDAIMLLIDIKTKKVLVAGRNGRNDHILDIRTGEELSRVNNFSVREIREDGTVAGIDTIENTAMELDGDKIYANVANRTKKRIEKRNLSEAFVKGNITSFTIKTLARISGSDKDKDIVASLGFETGYKAAWERAKKEEPAPKKEFTLPEVNEHLKIAKWHEENGVYYPEGSDVENGYEAVNLVLDRSTKKVILLGIRSEGWYLLDMLSGKQLSPHALTALQGFKGEDAYVTFPGDEETYKIHGDDVSLTEESFVPQILQTSITSRLVDGDLTATVIQGFAEHADSSTDDIPVTLGFESGYRAAFELAEGKQPEIEQSVENAPVERAPTLEELRYKPLYLDNDGLWKSKSTPQYSWSSFVIAVDKDTRQFALMGKAPNNHKYILDQDLARLQHLPVTNPMLGFDGENVDVLLGSTAWRYDKKGSVQITENTNQRIEEIDISDEKAALLTKGLTGKDIEAIIAAQLPPSDTKPSLACPYAFVRPESEFMQAETAVAEEVVAEKVEFAMPEIDENLKIAPWKTDGKVFYPEGSNPQEGYIYVDMIVDTASKQVIFTGTRNTSGEQYVLDIQTGKPLTTEPVTGVYSIIGDDIIARVGATYEKKILSGDTLTDGPQDTYSDVTRRQVETLLVNGALTAETIKIFADNNAEILDAEVTLGFASGYRLAFEREQQRKSEKAELQVNVPTFDEKTVFAKVVPFEEGFVVEGKEDAADRIVYSKINIAYDTNNGNRMLIYGREKDTNKMMLLGKDLQPVTPGIEADIISIGKDHVQIDSYEYDFYGPVTLTSNPDYQNNPQDNPHMRNYDIIPQLTQGDFTGSKLAEFIANHMGGDTNQFKWGFEEAYLDPEELRIVDQYGAVPWATNPENIKEVEVAQVHKQVAIMDVLSLVIDDAPETELDSKKQAVLIDYFIYAAVQTGIDEDRFSHLLQQKALSLPLRKIGLARRVIKQLPEKVNLSKEIVVNPKDIAIDYLERKLDSSRANGGRVEANIIKDDTLPPPYEATNWREKLRALFGRERQEYRAEHNPELRADFAYYAYRQQYEVPPPAEVIEPPSPIVRRLIDLFVEGMPREDTTRALEAGSTANSEALPDPESAEPEIGQSAGESIADQESVQRNGFDGKGKYKSK